MTSLAEQSATPAPAEPDYRSALHWVMYAIFVVPMTQVRILDLPYQLHAFEVFHRNRLNRWVHFIGMPMNLIALYAILLPDLGIAAVAVLAAVAIHHVLISMRHKLAVMAVVSLVANGALFVLARQVFEPYVFEDGVWLLNPWIHFFFWPFAQYATHSLEPSVPRPWSVRGRWSTLPEIVRQSPAGLLVLLALAAPFHVAVELISSWRNLFIQYLVGATRTGYRPEGLHHTITWIEDEVASASPLYHYDEFAAAVP